MNNDLIYSKNHLKIFDNLLLKKRLEIIEIVNDLIKLNQLNDVLDIGTTSDTNKSSNIIIKNLKNIINFHSISDQKIESSFFKKKLQKSITENFTQDEIDEFKSDLVISNATIEHVGNFNNQKKMLENISNLSKKFFIVITPNRFHPLEFHTKIPLIHWLPKSIHRKILGILDLSFFAKEENLNLLSKSDFEKIAHDESIFYEFKYIKFLFFKSNIIFIGKKK